MAISSSPDSTPNGSPPRANASFGSSTPIGWRGGDGAKAAHLIEYVLWARKADVTIRSIQDDGIFDDLMHPVLMGERSHEESKRKSQAVRLGKERQMERDERLGGPVPDGYRLTIERDDCDRVTARVYLPDPERAPAIRRIFAMAHEGHGA